MDEILKWILVGLGIILVLCLVIFLFKKKRVQPKTNLGVNVDFIIDAIGGIKNIIDINKEQNRIKIKLKDPKLLNYQLIQSHQLSAFVVGNEFKILIKEGSNNVYETLKKEKQNEEN